MKISLITATIKRLSKDIKLLLGVFSMPVIVIFVIANISGSVENTKVIELGIVDQEKTRLSEQFVEALDEDEHYVLKSYDADEAREAFENRQIPIVLTIPQGFFEEALAGADVSMKTVRVDSVPGRPVMDRVNRIVKTILQKELLAGLQGSPQPDTLQSDFISYETLQPERGPNRYLVISFVIIFMMFSVIFLSQDLIDLRRKNLLFRMYSTPHTPSQLTGSLMSAMYIIFAVQTVVLFTLGSLFIKAPVFINNIAGTVMILAAFILVNLSFGVLITRLCKTPNLLWAWANLFILPTGMISGLFVPREYLPEFLNNLAFLAPQHWVITGIQKMNAGEALSTVMPNVLILLLFAACMFSVGILRFDKLVKQ